MTLVGYQTNLLVYALDGYTFADFFRVGAPLQLLLAVVTILEIAFFWALNSGRTTRTELFAPLPTRSATLPTTSSRPFSPNSR